MSDEFITAKHIEKLGHHIPEIRERALLNIHSKLQRGILYDNDLARSKELFWQLFNWFRNNDKTKHDIVMNILLRIIQSEIGIHLIDLHGCNNLINEFNQLKSNIDEKCGGILQEILDYLDTLGSNEMRSVVPPLNLRDLDSPSSESESVNIGTTATTIAGFVDSFVSLDVADKNQPQNNAKTYRISPIGDPESPFTYFTFLWQWLIGADRHILESVEETMRNPSAPSALLNSCEFFTDVLLHDFPAEVFLQRPGIVKQLHDLLWSSPSSRITTAILKCLEKLTKEFINRIRYYDNPGTHNLKLNNFHIEGSPREKDLYNDNSEDDTDSLSTDVENIGETMNLMKHQMNIPQFCLNTINSVFDYLYVTPEAGDSFKRKKCLIGINIALVLLKDAIELLKLTVKPSIWEVDKQKLPNVETIVKKCYETFKKFGEVLHHFRIKVLSEDFIEETRLIQLHLLQSFINLQDNFIPNNQSQQILPANLKNALSDTLLDAPLNHLFPFLHHKLINLTKSFQPHEIYNEVTNVCESMTSAIKFLRDWKSLPFTRNISLMEEALESLEFHKNMKQISIFIELCANKLTMHSFDDEILKQLEEILLKLLTHYDEDIRLEVYKICQHKVVKTIGAKLNVSKCSMPGSQILFLLRGKILSCIALQGLKDENESVQQLSEDILIHVLKAKLLVNEEIWKEVVIALMPTLPLLLTFASDQKSLIGRHVLSLLDPDRSRLMNFSLVEVLRLNVGLLFVENSDVRMEAVSRLCWLLSSANDTNKRSLLPHLNNLHDRTLSNACQVERKLDFKTYRGGQTHFYQPSSLHQVIELLSSSNIEPVIRRSAITQVSVMMEDPLLHSTFLEANGLDIIKTTMLSALTDNDYQDYPDSVIPCLSILKNLCLYNASVRQELANSEEYFNYILRGVFLFCTENRVKQDCAVLLFLIVFNEYVKGSPVKNNLSIPDILQSDLKCPFETKTYLNIHENVLQPLTKLKEDKWALTSIQIHWNIEWFHGLNKLLHPEFHYDRSDDFSNVLKLTPIDLRALKSTSIEYLLKLSLNTIYESHVHEEILYSLHIITRCLNLFELVKTNLNINLETLEWRKSFLRYLNAPPAGEQDNILISHIFEFLSLLIPKLKPHNNELTLWVTSLITEKTHYINTLLSVELTSDQEPDLEKLLNSLLQLINACVISEQSLFTDPGAQKATESNISNNKYIHVVKTLVNNLQCSNTKHFYNLAYLDRLLTTLTHITATFGWSGSKFGEEPKKVLQKLAICTAELLNAFHCGKGPTAADSLMGLNITRNVIIVLNHLIAEMQHFNVKHWEDCFNEGDDSESIYRSVFLLKNSRDVILRAPAIHLLSGFAMSTKAAIQMIQDIAKDRDYLHLWKITLSILCDHEEAAIVRENAALLLTNLSSYISDNANIPHGILNKIQRTESTPESQKKVLIALLDACSFFRELETLLKSLRTEKVYNLHELRKTINNGKELDDFMFVYNKVLEISNMTDSLNCNPSKENNHFETICSITTPGLVKAVSTFVSNILTFLPQYGCKQLQELGLIKLFFKCVVLANVEIQHTRDLIFYSDILQMNTAICCLLAKSARINDNCLLTIGNARDCLNVLTALLDPSIYITSLPELQYLRNKLWSSVYSLLDVLLLNGMTGTDDKINEDNRKKYDTTSLILQIEKRKNAFLLSLCESISTDMSTDLQLSALNSLASLLRSDVQAPDSEISLSEEESEDSPESTTNLCSQRDSSRSSVQIILDNTKTTPLTSSYLTTINNNMSKLDVLKEVYFDSPTSTISSNKRASLSLSSLNEDNTDQHRMAGAELCKILLDLYESLNLQKQAFNSKSKRKTIVLNTLTGLLLISKEAKQFALEHGLLHKVMEQLKTIYVQLSLENVDCLRKVADKKRLSPVLQELESLIGLIMNFIYGCEEVKQAAGRFGLADIIHKLWNWLLAQRQLHLLGMRLLCTLTSNCPAAASTLALTTSVAGAGPRKSPGNNSILHVICGLITKEMELVSRTHCLQTLKLAFDILHNTMEVNECRFILTKSNVWTSFTKLHPSLTKRQKPWEQVEFIWLEFLHVFSSYPEGQTTIGKFQEMFEIVLCLCGCPNENNRREALETLRNLAFNQSNRARLLGSDEFLNILHVRLTAANPEEVKIVVSTMWALAANCQKAKMTFKGAKLDQKINDFLRISYLNNFEHVTREDVNTMQYVLSLITQS